MDWDKELSANAMVWMKFLGDFSPTCNEARKELKGYMFDESGGGKAYIYSGELRELARACIEVADWLDKRAESHD